jgi:NSS family neurotransmitter:Na+ symporter
MYIILAFLLAYPVLMAELIIGRATRSNMVDALGKITGRTVGRAAGVWGFITVCLILSFYAIIAGWMISWCLQGLTTMVGLDAVSAWLTADSIGRSLLFCAIFIALTASILLGGVSGGIEKWSVRLMPTLFLIVGVLIFYVATLDGAKEGMEAYLLPDFSKVTNPDMLISAMGQAFFSMSLGVGTMLVYGSYIGKNENLPNLGASVALVDIGVAVLAGLLIIPAMYVAMHNGVQIFNDGGELIAGPTLIFTVLPELFTTMGDIGVYVSFAFFALMVIAALTSSISMLEVPVAYIVESKSIARSRAVWFIAAAIFGVSTLLIVNSGWLFDFVVSLTTEYSQPLLGLVLSVFAGWLWNRNEILKELNNGNENAEHSFFWKVWPWYIKFVCPVIIIIIVARSMF